MAYQITFEMTSPVCFIDRPAFDSILAYCWMAERGRVTQGIHIEQEALETFDDLPLVKHPDGYFLASLMVLDEEVSFVGSWKKRWHVKDDHLVDFGKAARKVDVQGGQYKSYAVPLSLHSTKAVHFYFESENVGEVERLIEKHLVGIGKKRSQGYGFFEGFEIKSSDRSFETELLRPVPVKPGEVYAPKDVRYVGWKIPYWLPENMALCHYPRIEGAPCST